MTRIIFPEIITGGGVYNTGHFLDRVVLLRSNPRFCPIFRPSAVIGVIFALEKGPRGVIAVIYNQL